ACRARRRRVDRLLRARRRGGGAGGCGRRGLRRGRCGVPDRVAPGARAGGTGPRARGHGGARAGRGAGHRDRRHHARARGRGPRGRRVRRRGAGRRVARPRPGGRDRGLHRRARRERLNAWSRGHANNQGRDRDHVERRAAARARRTDRRGAARGAGTASRPGRGRAQPRDPRARAPRGDGGPAGRRVRARPLRRGRVMTTTTTQQVQDEPLVIAGRTFRSRLIVGTGKYRDNETMVRAIEASGAEMVTVAVRRVDLDRTREEGILYHLDPERIFLLPNTAGCYSAEEAVRYARLGRAAGLNDWVKLEVIGDQRTLLPDVSATLEAARILVAEGFKVLAYTNEDVVTALRLEDAGCAAVMPLAS